MRESYRTLGELACIKTHDYNIVYVTCELADLNVF